MNELSHDELLAIVEDLPKRNGCKEYGPFVVGGKAFRVSTRFGTGSRFRNIVLIARLQPENDLPVEFPLATKQNAGPHLPKSSKFWADWLAPGRSNDEIRSIMRLVVQSINKSREARRS